MAITTLKPKAAVAANWKALATLAGQIGTEESKAFNELGRIAGTLRNAKPYGKDNDENVCNRLRKLSVKVSFAISPKDHFASLRTLSAAVLALVASFDD